MPQDFFWLHIKKSAGQSTRAALGPLYTETNRRNIPSDIRDLPAAEWNDALNNYRIDLGAWQFRRCAYAQTQLWPKSWTDMIRVGFARQPVDRCVSMFEYLFDPVGGKHLRPYLCYLRRCNIVPLHKRLAWSRAARFDTFLDAVEWQDAYRRGPDPAAPIDLHFSTHTNPMSRDVLQPDGTLALSHLIRLESFEAGIDLCYDLCKVTRPEGSHGIRRNSGATARRYEPSPQQRRRIEHLYAKDCDLYENALVL